MKIMGILNITEDSFSDGGRYLDMDAALAHAERLVAEGADIIDIGGESTRPGATRVDAEVELGRVVPVITELSKRGVVCSVDTMRASVAAAAVDAGANIINDVSGGLADPDMLSVMADTGAKACLMHWATKRFGDASGTSQADVASVLRHLLRRADAAEAKGVDGQNIILDPGLGFAKTPQDNWNLLGALQGFVATGYPVLIGASRKRFLADLGTNHTDVATAAVSAVCATSGVWGVRVHDVAATRVAMDVVKHVKEHTWTA